MKIGIGADHRGVQLKSSIISFLEKKGHTVVNYGTDTTKSVDYPKIALRLAEDVSKKKLEYGVLICYTGIGMSMTANKVKGVRAALCTNVASARLTRAHNDANVLVIPGMMKYSKLVRDILVAFLSNGFEGGRHRRRVNIIKKYEKAHWQA